MEMYCPAYHMSFLHRLSFGLNHKPAKLAVLRMWDLGPLRCRMDFMGAVALRLYIKYHHYARKSRNESLDCVPTQKQRTPA